MLKGQKEEEERLLQAIPLFCFPDGNNWAPVTEFPRYLPDPRSQFPTSKGCELEEPSLPHILSFFFCSETFSFVLTDVDGSRKIGYCRRLLVSIPPLWGHALESHLPSDAGWRKTAFVVDLKCNQEM